VKVETELTDSSAGTWDPSAALDSADAVSLDAVCDCVVIGCVTIGAIAASAPLPGISAAMPA
jgi:hypothetical protein